jgi:hypothetical protein
VGQVLIDDARVHAISFTGSAATGARVIAGAAPRHAKLQLEMGGKNPLVVLDVQEGILPTFVAALRERMQGLAVDDARKPGTQIGPVVDAAQLETDLEYVALGRAEGATLVCGGERVKRATDGFFLQPALFTDALPTMRIAREEIFAGRPARGQPWASCPGHARAPDAEAGPACCCRGAARRVATLTLTSSAALGGRMSLAPPGQRVYKSCADDSANEGVTNGHSPGSAYLEVA